MSRPQKFVVMVERTGENVRVDLITPDGELEPIAEIASPTQLLGFSPMFAAMMASMVTQAVLEARGT